MTARHKSKKAASQAVESAMQRAMRIGDSQNGATLRTRVVKSKNKYQRNLKHKTSFASAEDVFLCRFATAFHTLALYISSSTIENFAFQCDYTTKAKSSARISAQSFQKNI